MTRDILPRACAVVSIVTVAVVVLAHDHGLLVDPSSPGGLERLRDALLSEVEEAENLAAKETELARRIETLDAQLAELDTIRPPGLDEVLERTRQQLARIETLELRELTVLRDAEPHAFGTVDLRLVWTATDGDWAAILKEMAQLSLLLVPQRVDVVGPQSEQAVITSLAKVPVRW
ncbi:MAG: hypothetical protein AAF533_03175 [Acidobacteriota bacterium]